MEIEFGLLGEGHTHKCDVGREVLKVIQEPGYSEEEGPEGLTGW